MKIKIIVLLAAFLTLAESCEKETTEPAKPVSYIKASINGQEVIFNQFSFMGTRSERQSQWQIMRATSPKGETPLRQIYCMIYSPNDGINKLNRASVYDKVRLYYSEDLNNYAAWEGVKNSKAEFNLDSVKRTSQAFIYYKTGKFNGVVYNKQKDSLIITNGEFQFHF